MTDRVTYIPALDYTHADWQNGTLSRVMVRQRSVRRHWWLGALFVLTVVLVMM